MPASDLLRTARQRAGLTQRQLAERTGIPQPSIARIESGRADVRVGTLEILLDGCSSHLVAESLLGFGDQDENGVDRTLVRQLLLISPSDRVSSLQTEVAGIQRFRRAFHETRSDR